MILFISDIHLGRGTPEAERANEAALVACLRAHAADAEALYLVGDVFDEYIEYRSLVPKGFVRFQALLAEWTDRGVPVTYLVGNHDPWHRDYFERELGVRVVFESLRVVHHGRTLYLTHGDGLSPTDGLYRRLKPVLRHRVPVGLYKTLLPADAGFRLARWVNRRFGHKPVEPETAEHLRLHARYLLAETPTDLVVMGHSHVPDVQRWPEGTYLNPGFWNAARTFGRLDATGVGLFRWNGAQPVAVDPEE